MKAFLLLSHGSHYPVVTEEVTQLVKKLRQESSARIIEWAFLKIGSPSVLEGVEHCVQQGATEIVVLLNFLNSGRYVLEDIPRAIEEARQAYPQVPIQITKPIGQHYRIAEILLEIIG